MFPMPAMLRWSSSNALIGAVRPRASARRCAAVNRSSRAPARGARAKNSSSAASPSSSSPGPEAARIHDHQAPAARALPARQARSRTHVCAGSGSGSHEDRAGHPQVLGEVEPHRTDTISVLAAAPSRSIRRPMSASAELLGGERARPAGVEDLDARKLRALDQRRQLAADRLDLGQLGHRPALGCASGARRVSGALRARVCGEVDVLEVLGREVGVELGGREVGVAEHLLQRAQVAAAGEQVRGERVAQRVRAHALAGRRCAHDPERSCTGPGG